MQNSTARVYQAELCRTVQLYFYELVRVVDEPVAGTGKGFEQVSINYRNSAVNILDRAGASKHRQCEVYVRSSCPQHLSQEILSQGELISARAIMGHQQPAGA